MPFIDIQVAGGIGKQFRHPAAFLGAFREVGMQVHAGVFGEQGGPPCRVAPGWRLVRNAASRHIPTCPRRASFRSVTCCRGNPCLACREDMPVHSGPSGPCRRSCAGFVRRAAVKNADTDCGCTVPNTRAVVVPLRNSSSRKNEAVLSAWAMSSNCLSAGKVWVSSQSRSRVP